MTKPTGIIESVLIDKLWGLHDVKLQLHNDINFLTGVNGSGKTTVIKLVVAVLTADLQYLLRTSFKKIVITVREKSNSNSALVSVERISTGDTSQDKLCYQITGSSQPLNIPFDIGNTGYIGGLGRYAHRYFSKQIVSRDVIKVQNAINEIVNVTWLSVQRFDEDEFYREEEHNQSLVDEKLKEQSDNLVRHLSALKALVDDLLNRFQRKVFLSLIPLEPQNEKLVASIASTDVLELRKAFKQIFEHLDLFSLAQVSSSIEGKAELESKIDDKFGILNDVKKDVETNQSALGNDNLVLFYNAMLINNIVTEWKEYLKLEAKINKPKNIFIDEFNRMSTKKKVSVNQSNELVISTKDKEPLEITKLSSGEKQLLIILTEALLQNARPYVYIADEPELSLHVNWQETLVTSIRAINPKAQIFFATHSPEIVGPFQEKMFDMEDITL